MEHSQTPDISTLREVRHEGIFATWHRFTVTSGPAGGPIETKTGVNVEEQFEDNLKFDRAWSPEKPTKGDAGGHPVKRAELRPLPLATDGGNLPNTIDKYLVQIREAAAPLGIYAYRGQGKAEWKLHSAATRLLVREYGDSITSDETEFRKLYVDYHRETLIGSARTRGFGVEIGRHLNDWELLAKLQHFGAPTGLLDFSWSPLVALWFACEEPDNDGELFMVDTGDPLYAAQLQTDTEHHDLASVLSGTQISQQMSYWEPSASGDASARILRQRSLFIVGRPLVHVDGRMIKALRIAQGDKNQLLSELKTLDVNQESLFLDIHGFAGAIQRRRLPDITPVAHVRTANRFYQQGQYEGAIHHYTRAIRLGQASPLTHFLRGNSYSADGKHAEALKDYDDAVNQDAELLPSTRSALYFNRGNSNAELGNCNGAILNYTKAIDIEPDVPHYYYNRGNSYLDLSRFQEALDDYGRVSGDTAGHAAFNAGNALLSRGLLTEAKDSYKDAEKKGGNPDGIGQNLFALGQMWAMVEGLEYDVKAPPEQESGMIQLKFLLPEPGATPGPAPHNFLIFGRAGNTGNTGGPGLIGGPGFPGKPFTLVEISVEGEAAE